MVVIDEVFFATLTTSEQAWLQGQLAMAPADQSAIIGAMFDARGLSCPMPLLKAKLALRPLASGLSLYLCASDPNSQKDLLSYCQKNQYPVIAWTNDGTFDFVITQI